MPTSTMLMLSERWFTTQTSLFERAATATGSSPTDTESPWVREPLSMSKISRRLSGVLTANNRVPSGDSASGRTWPLSKATKVCPVTAVAATAVHNKAAVQRSAVPVSMLRAMCPHRSPALPGEPQRSRIAQRRRYENANAPIGRQSPSPTARVGAHLRVAPGGADSTRALAGRVHTCAYRPVSTTRRPRRLPAIVGDQRWGDGDRALRIDRR